MDILPAGRDLPYRADLKDLAYFQRHITDLGKRIDMHAWFEFVPAMNARTHKHLKCPAKTMLMYCRHPLKPEINVDMKPRTRINRYRRVGETCVQIPLPRKLVLFKCPFDCVPRRKLSGQFRL